MVRLINRRAFKRFFRSGSAGGFILIACLIVSLLVANSPLGDGFTALLNRQVGYESDWLHLRYSVLLWINDGLMAIFFLLVGLEIKRELVEGELSSLKQAALPVFAAMGGMLVPAGIYALLNSGTEAAAGWGIPMATDIAFAIAVLAILGSRVPPSLKIFLTALAIVDDLGAILVIAIFYSSELHLNNLLYAGGIFLLLVAFNMRGVKSIWLYLIPGIFIWYFIHHSGIHATIAGVLVALTLPTTVGADESPLEKLEHAIARPVNFLIMPIFALANTNIRFEEGMVEGLASTLGLGIILGLMVGKPVGILAFTWASAKLGLSKMPEHVRWVQIWGIGMLAGIGFTMSIFIALLSFPGHELLQTEAKFSILIASLLSGVLGYLFLRYLARRYRLVAETPVV